MRVDERAHRRVALGHERAVVEQAPGIEERRGVDVDQLGAGVREALCGRGERADRVR
jgi:hypothetical protein